MKFGVAELMTISVLLRIGFFAFGVYQDTYMTVKYTDIDYLVFTDATNYVVKGFSPYLRETYRYTPLLAWMLAPTSWGGMWYSFGKFVFMAADLITGWIIIQLLPTSLGSVKRNIMASIWLLNPMVVTISTRGSSESILTVMIMLSLYFILCKNNVILSAIFLGLAIHFKIYPIIYLPSVLLYLSSRGKPIINLPLIKLINKVNLMYLAITIATMVILTGWMYTLYGYSFIYNAYLYHLTRIDHRHNFSVYNVALYYKSAVEQIVNDRQTKGLISHVVDNFERYAFVPQLLISGILIPLSFAKTQLLCSLFLQTFAFVTFNKVITSQYFIWFLIFLPNYLAGSKLLQKSYLGLGLTLLLSWVATQGLWLYNAYNLEFLGISTFDSGLFYSASLFYLSNCWILSVFIDTTT